MSRITRSNTLAQRKAAQAAQTEQLNTLINNDLKTLHALESSLNTASSNDPVVNLLKQTLSVMLAQLIDTRQRVLTIENDASSLQSDLSEVSAKSSMNEQYSRRNNLTVVGLSISGGELGSDASKNDLSKRVADTLSTPECPVKVSDFSAIHRNGPVKKPGPASGQAKGPGAAAGKAKVTDNKVPSITVRFHSSNVHDNVLKHYKNYENSKAKPVRAYQSLTPYFSKLRSDVLDHLKSNDSEAKWCHWRPAGLCVKLKESGKLIKHISTFADFTSKLSKLEL